MEVVPGSSCLLGRVPTRSVCIARNLCRNPDRSDRPVPWMSGSVSLQRVISVAHHRRPQRRTRTPGSSWNLLSAICPQGRPVCQPLSRRASSAPARWRRERRAAHPCVPPASGRAAARRRSSRRPPSASTTPAIAAGTERCADSRTARPSCAQSRMSRRRGPRRRWAGAPLPLLAKAWKAANRLWKKRVSGRVDMGKTGQHPGSRKRRRRCSTQRSRGPHQVPRLETRKAMGPTIGRRRFAQGAPEKWSNVGRRQSCQFI